MAQTTVFSPQDFLAQIDSLSQPSAPSLWGMAKRGNDPQMLMLSTDACASWAEIPVASIARVEMVRMVRCRDHEHPFVILDFKPGAPPQPAAPPQTMVPGIAPDDGAPQDIWAEPPVLMMDAVYMEQDSYEDCAKCLNNCQNIDDRDARIACIKSCACGG